MQLQMPGRYIAPPPIEVGDRVEVAGKSGGSLGVVIKVETIERPFKRPGGFVIKPAPLYTVRLSRRRTVKTQSVSYAPTPEIVAARAAAVRGQSTRRAEVDSDFVGYDGPGIRETRLVGNKGTEA
jgi:hypothetical protein